MLVVDGDFENLKAEIKRCEERGDHEAADTLRKHLAELEALQLQDHKASKSCPELAN